MASISAEELKTILADQKTALAETVTTSINAAFDAKIAVINDKVDGAIARVETLEQKAANDREVDSSRLLAGARREFDSITREMFHESGLVLSKPASSRSTTTDKTASASVAATAESSSTLAAIQTFVDGTVGPGKYTVEPTKIGFRLVHTSRSTQTRRADAAKLNTEQHRQAVRTRFGLSLSIDRPYAYRTLVREAYKFLEGVKASCPAVKKIEVSKGLCFVNSLPLGPMWLVPPNREIWPEMITVISREFARMPTDAGDIGADGYFDSLFKHAFVSAARGGHFRDVAMR